MKALVLLGSPRPQGNTAALTAILCDQLQQGGVQTEVLSLYEKEILPCVACRGCQQDWSAFACVRKDDVASIAEKILDCDLMVLATPIYSWYCTPPMKALLDCAEYYLQIEDFAHEGPAGPAGVRHEQVLWGTAGAVTVEGKSAGFAGDLRVSAGQGL